MKDFGTDFRLLDDDVVFTPDGDIEIICGPACVAQDIDQELKTAVGRLVWDKAAGSSMMLMLNDSLSDRQAVITELQRVAAADRRVDPISVAARQLDDKRFRLQFRPMDAVTTAVLEYDLSKGNI